MTAKSTETLVSIAKVGETMNPRRLTVLLLMLAGIASLLVACGTDPTATPTSVPTPTATPLPPDVTPEPTATPTPVSDTFAQDWAALIEAAQAEGQLVMALSGSDTREGRFWIADFQNKFGIEVIASGGSGSDNANRILAERSRGRYTVDIATASGGSAERLAAAGAFVPIEPLLVHPEVIDRSHGWWLDEVIWADSDKKYKLADSLSVGDIGSIWYNPNKVTQAEKDLINDYWDLTRPEFKGRLAMRAMNNPGGKSVIARLWLAPGLGPEFLEAIHRETDIDLVCAECDKELAEGVANGKWDFGIFGGSADFEALQALGLPVRDLHLEKGVIGSLSTEISGGVAVMDRAPHPNAAKLFANWWYSREGQTSWKESEAAFGPLSAVSLRSDVPLMTTPEFLQKVIVKIPEWRADGSLSDRLVVYETNDEWFNVREQTECFFNELYKDLGYDAWINYTLSC